MELSIEVIKALYDQAKSYKSDILSSYNETFEYTDAFFKINDASSKSKLEKRKIDSVILTSQRFLCNFIMTSLFSRGGSWAILKVNPVAYKELLGEEGETAQASIESINRIMEKNSDIVYNTIENTNYYTETSKALMDCLRVGTGVRKTVELASRTNPISYEYISLDNFYYLEDSFGKPTITFKVYPEKTRREIEDMFGSYKSFKLPSKLSEDNDPKKNENILEIVIPDFDESSSVTKYIHQIYTENLEELLLDEVLDYQPYRVFRWGTDTSNPWGLGIGRENIDLFKELSDYKTKRHKHADKIVDPPVNFRGNLDLIYKVSLAAGARNYAGDGQNGENNLGVEPINLGSNLLPVEQDIAECRERIRAIYMAQPLGDIGDTKNRSATEMSLRHEMFRKEFSGTYELLNTELLSVTFLDVYIILKNKQLLETLEEKENFLEFSYIQYVNEITKSAGAEEVMNVVNWYQINFEMSGEERRKYLMDMTKFAKYSAEKMRIPLDLLLDENTVKAQMEQEQRIAQLVQLGGITNPALQGQATELAGELGGNIE